MLQTKTVFITGGAGFIGSTLAGKLAGKNKVVIYDDLTRNSLKDREFANHPNITLIQGDILDISTLEKCMAEVNPSHIIHCAAVAGIDTVIKKPVRTMEVNMTGTANVLRAASKQKAIERVICFSTSEVFGSQAFLSDEKDGAVIGMVGEARWTYAVSKLSGEHLALAYFKEQGLPVVVLRPFNVYGPGQVGEGALSTFIQRAIDGENIEIHGDGTQIRAWCYVDDMVRGILTTLEHPKAVGETFNIGNQRAVLTIYGLASTVIRVLNSSSEIVFVYKNYADVELRVPNISKARDLLGFEAQVDIDEGILLTADYFRSKLGVIAA
ncbi:MULTISPECIES: NAD-dependent epimerase/dehydratase family protein [Cyanophyceae]|uniref:NAD-dependent epimerase/dehydratase family protein n=1 Tax=Cyanophyceae TaxID=3028117 RepID=UPI001685206D|nr:MULTISPECIES: NAD-dependent epimerase/dehydratase family protein [Cyanophyceae]MBD1915652.1 NAD-dependent epimerase/dehydratase family protein [Phormidium sp. FACHB-77]MBD2029286.1 NAD-dependent epimerase/dehydratase family protein [Phormidium sp. FACHB-322]MBD2049276.1 NAD-dependent epimerase/dehydratase family protein [Leptolyngbya sp. FACHB-60]